jgi:hypothetical protein
MAEWSKVATNVGVGLGAGVVDQLVQNQDDKRAAEYAAKGEKLGLMKSIGTYVNYGVPILSILLSGLGYLRGDWETRALVASSQMAGRKVTWQMTARKTTPGYAFTEWTRDTGGGGAQEAKMRAALEKAKALMAAKAAGARGQIDEFSQIPVLVGGEVLT